MPLHHPNVASGPLLVAATLLCHAPSPIHAQSPMFRGSMEHSGASTEPQLTHFGGVAWRLPVNGTVRASATVRSGAVYIGGADSVVYALTLHTGEVRWRTRTTAAVSATIGTTSSRAIVHADDGTIQALSLRDGSVQWTRPGQPALPLAWGLENGDYFTSSPLILSDEAVVVGGRDGVLLRLDAATGRVRWTFSAGAQVWGSPAAAGGIIVVGDQRGRVHGVDAASGRERWIFRAVADSLRAKDFGFDRQTIQSSPAISGNTVLVGARDGFLYALDLATGRERWRYDHKVSWINASPAVSDGLVFVTSSDGAFADAIELESGRERWRATGLGLSWSSPLVAGDFVYVTTARGWVYALDRATGTRRWAWRADGAVWSSPVLAGGLLLVGSDDGGLYALRGDRDLRRVAYWDSSMTRINAFGGHLELRDFLASRGWEVLGTDSLVRFLDRRIADRAPSVVVFTLDQLPPELAAVAADTVLLRRYLDAGGKVVWTGVPPLLWPRDTTGPDFANLNRGACAAVLGVDCGPGNFDEWQVEPTAAGRQWGLSGWWVSRWSVEPRSVTTVLASDQHGLASSFVKEYGGAPGSGFVRLGGADLSESFRTRRRIDPEVVRRIAEYFPQATAAP